MNRYSIVIAVAAALTVAWAAQTPASHKREQLVVSSTPAMKGHSAQHPFEVECLPSDNDLAEPVYLYVNPYHQLDKGDPCPPATP